MKLMFVKNCHLGNSAQSSIAISHRSLAGNTKDKHKIKLPLLLELGDNTPENTSGGGGFTIVSGRNGAADKQTERNYHTRLSTDLAARRSNENTNFIAAGKCKA